MSIWFLHACGGVKSVAVCNQSPFNNSIPGTVTLRLSAHSHLHSHTHAHTPVSTVQSVPAPVAVETAGQKASPLPVELSLAESKKKKMCKCVCVSARVCVCFANNVNELLPTSGNIMPIELLTCTSRLCGALHGGYCSPSAVGSARPIGPVTFLGRSGSLSLSLHLAGRPPAPVAHFGMLRLLLNKEEDVIRPRRRHLVQRQRRHWSPIQVAMILTLLPFKTAGPICAEEGTKKKKGR